MGIREEIEKLRLKPWREIAGTLYYRDEDRDHNRVIDAVLSIFDEWECILRGEMWHDDSECNTYIQGMIESHIKPGDHISIYVRRKK